MSTRVKIGQAASVLYMDMVSQRNHFNNWRTFFFLYLRCNCLFVWRVLCVSVTSLFINVNSWVQRTKEYNTALVQKGFSRMEHIVQKYSSWNDYMDHVSKLYRSRPSPRESGTCPSYDYFKLTVAATPFAYIVPNLNFGFCRARQNDSFFPAHLTVVVIFGTIHTIYV